MFDSSLIELLEGMTIFNLIYYLGIKYFPELKLFIQFFIFIN